MRRTEQELADLKARAVELRAAGVGGKRIAKELGIGGALVCELLRGVPLPGSLQRPRAKDGLRDAAVELRLQGRTYDEIVTELGVSKGSLSLWLRELPHPTADQRIVLAGGVECDDVPANSEVARLLRAEGWLLREIAVALSVTAKTVCLWTRGIPVPPRAMHGKSSGQMRALNRASWDARLAAREVEREAVKDAAAARVGSLSTRELELIAVTAYWCEGSKDKPYARREKVIFINSDPGLLTLYYGWLRSIGTPPESFRFRVHIHERADVAGAQQYWADVLDVDVARFGRPTLKRDNPTTTRANTGEGYYGCLVISVCQSRLLYQHIAGVWRGIVDASSDSSIPDRLVGKTIGFGPMNRGSSPLPGAQGT